MILSSYVSRMVSKESKELVIALIQKVALLFVCSSFCCVSATIVGSAYELLEALESVSYMKERKIYLKDGVYRFDQAIYLNVDNTKIYSLSGSPKSIVLEGLGMRRSVVGVNNLIRVSANDVEINGVTMRNAGNHYKSQESLMRIDSFCVIVFSRIRLNKWLRLALRTEKNMAQMMV